MDPGKRSDQVVWLKRPGQIWRELGPAYGLQSDSDEWGAKTASFYVPVGEITPRKDDEVDLIRDTTRVWSGRVTSTRPAGKSDGRDFAVCSAEGWQYHLDDDVLNALYVHDRLSEWRDMRGFPNAGLWRGGTSGGQVQVGDGAVMLSWPSGTDLSNDAPTVGVVLDLGPNPACWTERVHLAYSVETFSPATGLFALFIRSASDEGVWDIINGFEDGTYIDPAVVTPRIPTSTSVTFTELRRYVAVILAYQDVAFTTAEDLTVKLLAIRCFAQAAYEAGGASGLLVSDVVKDLLAKGATKLSGSTARVVNTSAPLTHFTTEGPASTRQSILRATSQEGLQPRIDMDRNPVLHSPATVPAFLTTAKATFDRSPGEAQINKVVVSSTDTDGTMHELVRHSAELDGRRRELLASPAPANPSFDADVSGWTAVGGPLPGESGTLGIFWEGTLIRCDTPPGCALVVKTPDYIKVGDYVETEVAGTHELGNIYVAEVRINRDARQSWKLWYGAQDSGRWVDFNAATFIHGPGIAVYDTARVAFCPHQDYASGVFLRVESQPNIYDPWNRHTVTDYYLDSVRIYRSLATSLDVAGTVRARYIDVRSAMPTDRLLALTGSYLDLHGRDRLVGNLTVPAGGVVRLPDGTDVHPEDLQDHVGELVHIRSEIDPETGNPGRNGRIAGASFDGTVATVQVDERTEDLEVLLGQMDANVRG